MIKVLVEFTSAPHINCLEMTPSSSSPFADLPFAMKICSALLNRLLTKSKKCEGALLLCNLLEQQIDVTDDDNNYIFSTPARSFRQIRGRLIDGFYGEDVEAFIADMLAVVENNCLALAEDPNCSLHLTFLKMELNRMIGILRLKLFSVSLSSAACKYPARSPRELFNYRRRFVERISRKLTDLDESVIRVKCLFSIEDAAATGDAENKWKSEVFEYLEKLRVVTKNLDEMFIEAMVFAIEDDSKKQERNG